MSTKKIDIEFSFLLFFLLIFSNLYAQFPYDGKLYFFQDVDGIIGGSSYLSYIDNYTGIPIVSQVCLLNISTSIQHNGLAANPVDGYLYYLQTDNGTSSLYKTNFTCNSAFIGNLSGTSIVGCFDNKGRYWCIINDELQAYAISNMSVVLGPYTGSFSNYQDISYNMYDCHLYLGNESQIIKVDTSGVIVANYTPGFKIKGHYGGTTIGKDGNLYGMNNSVAGTTLSKFDLTTFTTDSIFSFSPGTPNDDVEIGGMGSDMAAFPFVDSIKVAFSTSVIPTCTVPITVDFIDSSQGNINSWNWNFGDGDTSTQQNPTHIYDSIGTYTITLICANTQAFCIELPGDTFSTSIEIKKTLPVSSTKMNVVCTSKGSIVVTPSGGTPPYSYIWSTNPIQTDSNITKLSSGIYTVTATDSNGCDNTLNIAVDSTFYDLVFDTTKTNAICDSNGTASINPISGTPPYSYFWFTFPFQTTTSVSGLAPGNYSVSVTDSNGCSTFQYFDIDYECPSVLSMPTIFTPNGDNFNDVLLPTYERISELGFDLKIYNRWGTLLYETTYLKQGWDGKNNNGIDVPEGTYYYILKALGTDNVTYNVEGFVMLVR